MASVLVVDDSPTHAELMRSILQQAGWDADTVGDGRQAVQAMGNKDYDAIVSDLNMPVMDGKQLVQHLVADAITVPVIVVTARGSESLAVDALALGATNFVPKNSMHTLLVPVVQQSLAFRRANERMRPLRGELKSPEFYFKIVSDTQSVVPVAEYLVKSLAGAGCGTPNDRYRIATATASAIYNAIRYGNYQSDDEDFGQQTDQQDPAYQLAVRIKVSVATSDTRISVSHEGAGSLTRAHPAPGTPESFEVEQCRGLMLMTSF